jgi:hypothetical protein
MAIADFGAHRISAASDFEDLAFEWLQCRDRFSGHLFDLPPLFAPVCEKISGAIRIANAHTVLQLLAVAAAQSETGAAFE